MGGVHTWVPIFTACLYTCLGVRVVYERAGLRQQAVWEGILVSWITTTGQCVSP